MTKMNFLSRGEVRLMLMLMGSNLKVELKRYDLKGTENGMLTVIIVIAFSIPLYLVF